MEQFVRSFLARQVPCICDHLVTTALQRKLFSAKQITKIKVVRYSVQAVSAKQIAPLIIAKPTTALADETVQIHIENLQSNQPITLHSTLKTEQNDIWESYSHYISSSDGIVQVDKDKSHGGSYTGCEPMGFVWSLKPSPGSPEHSRLRKHDVTVPFVVQVSVLDGHISEWSSDQTALAVINLDLWYMAPGVRRINIRHNGIVGTLFLPAGHGPFPGIVDLWGGVPGLIEFRASLLASHGFATLALAYIGHPDLPYPKGYLGVTSEYFEEAYNFLKNQPQVVKDRIGIIGYCSGVFFSLRMATEMLSIKPRCVVGVSGAHFWVMSTRTGHLYAFLTEKENDFNIFNKKNPFIIKDMIPLPYEPSQEVEVEKIRCPVLLISGEDDQAFPSVEASHYIEKKMKEAGNSHLLSRICYPGAGHAIQPPFTPLCRLLYYSFPGFKERVWTLFGGEEKAHAAAQVDAWKQILIFLKQHLVLS